MALDKSMGAVGCGHCRGLGASESCPACGLLVCRGCLDDDSCSVPRINELRLGMGARLRGVDPTGSSGIVTSWRGDARLVDLPGGALLERMRWWPHRDVWPLLVAPRRLLWINTPDLQRPQLVSWRAGDEEPTSRPIADARRADKSCLVQVTGDRRRGLAMRPDHKLVVLDLEGPRRLGIVGEKRRVVQTCAACSAMDLLAVGCFGRAIFYQLSTLRRLGARPMGQGEVDWIGLAGGRAVMISDDGKLELAQVDPARPPHLWRRRMQVDLEAAIDPVADLSPDGALLALRRRRRQVEIFNLSDGERQSLTGHTDDVNLVRFVKDGARLVTADEDNRVFSWPRSGGKILVEP